MTKTISCGVAGVGYLGRHHARIYHSLEGCELTGVFEPNDESAEKICQEYGCKRFADLDELADAADIADAKEEASRLKAEMDATKARAG